jgi:hypothetical protein
MGRVSDRTQATTGGAQRDTDCGCAGGITIECRGDVNITNCCSHDGHARPQPSSDECADPKGACMPVVPGAKHKQSRDYKLAKLAAGVRAPSVLAAAAVHTSRRFLAGQAAANPPEEAVYATLRKMPRSLVACTVDAVDGMAPAHRARLISSAFDLDIDQPVGEAELSQAFAAEIVQRVGESLFDDPDAGDQERPGQVRVYKPQGEDFFSQVRICSVNGIRTASFIPAIAIGDRLPGEIQRDCSAQVVDGQAQMVCVDLTANCPGETLGSVCARVLDVAQGEAVTIDGVNFFNVDAKVRFVDDSGTTIRDVDAHVWGDLDTPVTEQVDGETRLVNDCRVHDRIVFRVPDDLPPRVWRFQVAVPNTTGIAELGSELVSNTESINVTVPETARFQIAVDTVIARQETSPEWFGSDEVGLQTFAAAFDRDLNLIDLAPTDDTTLAMSQQIRGDYDSGTRRDPKRTVFDHAQTFAGLTLVVYGDEIDSEKFYSGAMNSRLLLFGEIIVAEFTAAATAFKIAGLALATMSTAALVATGVGAAVLIGIAIGVALWAPADPIIRDSIGLSINDLAMLTSVSLPAPEPRTFTSDDDIVVNVNKTIPPTKLPFEYLETREYVSDSEDSRYELIYRFSRLA